LIHCPPHLDPTLKRVESIDSLGISAWDVRAKWDGTCSDEQMIERFPPSFAIAHLLHAHPPLCQVYFHDLVESSSVNILLLLKSLRCTGDQRLNVVDNPADVVGDPSGGIRGVRASLEGNDLQFRPLPTGLRGRTHSRRITANDH
jgi:hypothetical protein